MSSIFGSLEKDVASLLGGGDLLDKAAAGLDSLIANGGSAAVESLKSQPAVAELLGKGLKLGSLDLHLLLGTSADDTFTPASGQTLIANFDTVHDKLSLVGTGITDFSGFSAKASIHPHYTTFNGPNGSELLVLTTGGPLNQNDLVFDTPPAEVEDGEPLAVSGVSETAFNSTSAKITVGLSQTTLDPNGAGYIVYDNGALLTPTVTVAADGKTATLSGILSDGENQLDILVPDASQSYHEAQTTLWAGSGTAKVAVLDQDGKPAVNLPLTALLTEDQTVAETVTTDASGVATLTDLPDRDVTVTGTLGQQYGSVGILGIDGSDTLKLKGFGTPSTVDNNDLSQGTAGWLTGNGPVTIIPHVEGAANPASATAATSAASTATAAPHATVSAVASAPADPPAAAPAVNNDIELGTSGEGERSMSRTFTVADGVNDETVRFKFITSEVPGGYFGTKYNDYYRVVIRDLQSGAVKSDANSMNGLGLGAFDASGATGWRELSLNVKPGDTVEVDVAVANVADGLYDSQVVVDAVQPKTLAITAVNLYDIDNTSLKFLSVDQNNTHFGGNTDVNGTISFQGEKGDTLTSVKLDIIQNGQVVTQANLSEGAKEELLGVPFQDSGTLSINTKDLLFQLTNSEAASVDVSKNGTLSLRVEAATSSGASAQADVGSVKIVTEYHGTNRYGTRDENLGGDDWALPSTLVAAATISSGLTYNDFSNMNAGPFAPHQTHNDGRDFDAFFPGYAIDAATASKIIGILNSSTGSDIQSIYVTYSHSDTDPFWNAIKDVTLADGRLAKSVIVSVPGHTTHFHVRMKP